MVVEPIYFTVDFSIGIVTHFPMLPKGHSHCKIEQNEIIGIRRSIPCLKKLIKQEIF